MRRLSWSAMTPAELGIIGPRVARDTARRYALSLRDEQAFLEQAAACVMRVPESEKEKKARLRQGAREWNHQGGAGDEIDRIFPVGLF